MQVSVPRDPKTKTNHSREHTDGSRDPNKPQGKVLTTPQAHPDTKGEDKAKTKTKREQNTDGSRDPPGLGLHLEAE